MEDGIDPGDRSADTQASSITTTTNESETIWNGAGKDCVSKNPGLTAATPADKAFEERRLEHLDTYRLRIPTL